MNGGGSMSKTLQDAFNGWNEVYTGFWLKRLGADAYAIRKRINEDIYHLTKNGEEIARGGSRREMKIKAIRYHYGTRKEYTTAS